MSAIAGIVAFRPIENPIARHLAGIVRHLEHRGKSDEGYVFFSEDGPTRHSGNDTNADSRSLHQLSSLDNAPPNANMALGHRLGGLVGPGFSVCHQPYPTAEGKFWAVLDGEITNLKQLISALKEEGAEVEHTDPVAVLLAGYVQWKERLLPKLDGSFTFIILDLEEGKLFGARDRFGVTPLYFHQDEDYLVFGSELKSLIGLPFVSKKVSKSAVYDYLVLGNSERQQQSMFRGLNELMPGSAFSTLLPRGNMKIWSYFQLNTDSKIESYSRNKVSTLAHRLRKCLLTNISNHISIGHPTAYHLEGSLESSVFPYLLKEYLRDVPSENRPKASELFCGIVSELEPNDSPDVVLKLAKNISEELNVELLQSVCSYQNFAENLVKVCYQQDLPFGSMDVFAQYRMLQSARSKDIQIVIDSSGSKQLFSSEPGHFMQYLQDLIHLGEYKLFLSNFFSSQNSMPNKWKVLRNISGSLLFNSTTDDLKETLLKNNQEEFSYLKGDFLDRYTKNLEENLKSAPVSLNQLLTSEYSGSRVKEMLRTSDRNAAYAGLVVRQPYASDREMAELMFKASSVYKIRAGMSANILRKSMRNILPDAILNAKPYGSQSNKTNQWLAEAKEDLKQFITPELDDFIDSKKVKRDWDKLFLTSENPEGGFLWRMINFAIWRQVYFGHHS